MVTPPPRGARTSRQLNRAIDRAQKLDKLVGTAVRVGVGAAGIAGVLGAVAVAKLAQKDFIENLYNEQLVFPADLDKYSISMAIDFKQYERRSIFRQPHMKSRGTIRLPIPKNLTDNYKASWEREKQDPIVGAAMESLLSSGGIAREFTDVMKNISEGKVVATAKSIAGLAGQIGGTATGVLAGAAFNAAGQTKDAIVGVGKKLGLDLSEASLGQLLQPLGLAENPFLTVLFKSPEFKEFRFNWRLAARTPKESQTINSIINMFKYHMLPDIPGGRALGGTLLQYPSMLQIGFYSNDEYLFRFKPCVIRNMTINYAPNSTPSFFKGNQNVPTEVDIALDLLEIEYWTRQDFNTADPNNTGGYIAGSTLK